MVCSTDTHQALSLVDTYSWLLHLNTANIRVVTDMVRVEDHNGESKTVYHAGIDLIQQLRQKYNFGHEVMIFCTDEKFAKQNCQERQLTDKVLISNNEGELFKFLSFLRLSKASETTEQRNEPHTCDIM